MEKKARNEIAVGMTVLVVLVLTFYVVIVLAGWPGNMEPKQDIHVKVPYTLGLRGLAAGSPIYIGGAKVGQVSETWIENMAEEGSQENDIYVYFTMHLPKTYYLREDCELVPKSNVLGGGNMLVIEDLGADGRVLEDGETVMLELGESLTDVLSREFDPDNPEGIVSQLKYQFNSQNDKSLMAALVQAAQNVKEITDKINQQVASEERATLMAKMHGVLDNLNKFTSKLDMQLKCENEETVMAKLNIALDTLNTDLEKIGKLIDTNQPNITEMFASLKVTAKTLEEDVPAITSKIKGTLEKVDTAMVSADEGLKDFKSLMANADETIRVNREDIDRVVQNVAVVSSNLKLVSQDVRRAPWKLLYKPKKDELKIQGLIDAAGAFAAGAERLDSASARLRRVLADAGENVNIDKETLDAIVAEIETSFKQHKKVEETFWQEIPD